MDDIRFEWLRDKVYHALNITDPEVFEELMNRDDGEYERSLAKFLNETPEEGRSAAIFYKRVQQEEREVEIEIEPSETDGLPENIEGDEGLLGATPAEEIPPTPAELVETPTEEKGKSKFMRRKGYGMSMKIFWSVYQEDTSPGSLCVIRVSVIGTLLSNRNYHDKFHGSNHLMVKKIFSNFMNLSQKAAEGGEGDPDAPSPEKQPTTKIIRETFMRTLLYMCHGHVPEQVAEEDCIYFIRNTPGMVDLPNTMDEAQTMLPKFFEYGILNGHSLVMLEQIITQVYIPLLSFSAHKNGDAPTEAEQKAAALSSSSKDSLGIQPDDSDEEQEEVNVAELQKHALLRDDFLINMEKFAKHIERTIQQIEGEVRLDIPDLLTDGDPTELAKDDVLIHEIENTTLEWTKQIASAVEVQLKKTPHGNGPLAEIDFWRERNAALSALSEQIKMPKVKKMLDILAKKDAMGDHAILQSFDLNRAELNKYYVEAKDNVRFLSTLERHFKNLTHGAGFQIVLDTIPSMMNALRMVWIISRHYNTDERMIPLMERIAWELAERVEKVINIRTIFKDSPVQVKAKTAEAKKTLEMWKECYLEVRAKIEASGRDARWEFDRKKLFERTDYMATICQNIYDVAQVLEEFYNIFGPELKSVTGDPQNEDFKLFFIFFESLFCTQVDTVQALFKQYQHNPPVSKNQPPVAGAIAWERSLFHRIKHTIIRFQSMEDMLSSEYGKAARTKYLGVARQMKEYEDKKYKVWREHVEVILPGLLKRNLLTRPQDQLPSGKTHEPSGGDDGDDTHRSLGLGTDTKYVVDFAPDLSEIITETKYMEQLGFSIPELARNVALQEDKYLRWKDGLNHMLQRYHGVISSIDAAETQLLDEHLKDLRRTLKPGHKRLNWNSLGIADYNTRCEQAISKFESLVNQIQKNAKDIDARLRAMELAELFKGPPPQVKEDILPSCKEFYDHIERERLHMYETLSRKYRAIGPLLTKMEGLVVHTNTGKSPRLAAYYAFWERRVYETLTRMVIRNLSEFNQDLVTNKPLFQIEAMLSAPEIILAPAANEIYKLTMQCVRDLVEGTKNFVRWMHGTCIETPPQNVDGEDEPYIFSFFSDISADPAVIELVQTSSTTMQKSLTNLTKYLNRWKRYRPLWKLDKTIMLEKFAVKNPTCVAYDDKLQFYSNLATEVGNQPKIKDDNCIRLHMKLLADTVRDHARKWVESLGQLLQDAVKEDLMGLKTELTGLASDLKRAPDTLEDLKFVLRVISDIRDMSLTVEMRIADILERYRTLSMYNLPVSEEETETCQNIKQMWDDLFLESKHVDASLVVVKKKFTEITQVQIGGFSTELNSFQDRFKMNGPGAVGNDLDKGVELLEQFKKEMATYERDRQELANAEKLFDLPITMYPELLQVQKEMSGLDKIYDIYKSQKAAREEWAQTLWANLNVNHLVDGIEGFIKSLKKLPRDIKGSRTAQMVEGRMKEFRDSIPLFVDLKNEALRDRHWKELMTKTGQSFDMNPDTFTLDNLFAMELHNFKEVIADIVTSASKELSIEKGIKEVTEVWEGMKFNVIKYMKGTQERGHIVGAVDEVMQILDDNSMNLQSMSASRFIGPFLNQVQTWEKSLSLIGEVLEVWLVVQRKWMYLESIFIGGDIRSQLPEEAKKFDAIDKTFKKVKTNQPCHSVICSDRETTYILDVLPSTDFGFQSPSLKEFEWESQLRFYWDREPDELNVRQCTGTFGYGYEYMGLNGRLVITPLTDRIYLTLTQALSMQLGGAPAGPAGTGKTETTKDLAKALGLLCVVTNCGEGMDYKAVGKIFSGLAQCGAWGCFDEFNRIDVSVLSVISSQIQTIRNALIHNLKRFQFEGMEIAMDNRMGIFITMNPGYAGRTELPESVKALFRPVVVIVPDLQQICEIMLFSEGFLFAKVLAKKMTVLYKLAKEQLSKQYHYDFGLRALKSVLVMAGELKRGSAELPEDVVLMRALRDMNLPKFVFEDVPLFLGLISDLFPGLDCPRVRYPNFNDAVEQVLEENNYILLDHQVDKVVQMYETMLTRHTTMVVGPTGGGKTVVINTLCQSQTKLGIHTKLYVMNPKAMSVIELYGILDPVTRDWTDGLLSNIFREINRPTDKNERKYILFDGDVDALWVENMNSVMDDNRLLTLANGERIRLQKHCALLFEVSDLQYASPATVSRCGMVFVDPKNLGYIPFWQRWVNARTNKAEQQDLTRLFEKYVPGCLDMILEGVTDGKQGEKLKMIVPLTALNLVNQLSRMLDALLVKELGESDVLECYFLEALYWSLGAALLEDGRIKFDSYIKNVASMPTVSDESVDAGPGELPGVLDTVYQYFFDKQKNKWIAWSKVVPKYVHDPEKRFNEILVPTVDTVRNTWVLEQMLSVKQPVLFVGDTGTSKTATIQDFLRNLDQDSHLISYA
nr:dynein axonemal heavy chain 10-like [Lytechinus pictus]